MTEGATIFLSMKSRRLRFDLHERNVSMTEPIDPAPDPTGSILFVPTHYSEANGFGAMRKLYKYVTADTGKKILENGTLRWSTPAVLNDPFDMQFAFQLPTDMQAAR